MLLEPLLLSLLLLDDVLLLLLLLLLEEEDDEEEDDEEESFSTAAAAAIICFGAFLRCSRRLSVRPPSPILVKKLTANLCGQDDGASCAYTSERKPSISHVVEIQIETRQQKIERGRTFFICQHCRRSFKLLTVCL